MKTRYCSSCKRGENKIEADEFVSGKAYSGSGRLMPLRGFYCSDHVQMMEDDGAEFTDRYSINVNEIVRTRTGWASFDEMCRNNPTLRMDGIGENGRKEMEYLRWEYYKRTGKVAEGKVA